MAVTRISRLTARPVGRIIGRHAVYTVGRHVARHALYPADSHIEVRVVLPTQLSTGCLIGRYAVSQAVHPMAFRASLPIWHDARSKAAQAIERTVEMHVGVHASVHAGHSVVDPVRDQAGITVDCCA